MFTHDCRRFVTRPSLPVSSSSRPRALYPLTLTVTQTMWTTLRLQVMLIPVMQTLRAVLVAFWGIPVMVTIYYRPSRLFLPQPPFVPRCGMWSKPKQLSEMDGMTARNSTQDAWSNTHPRIIQGILDSLSSLLCKFACMHKHVCTQTH